MFNSHGAHTARVGGELAQPDVSGVRLAEETEHFDQTYPLSPGGRVGVSNINGSIQVDAWDRNEVRVEYTKKAETKERLSDVQVKIDAKADYIRVESDYGNWNLRNNGRWQSNDKLTIDYKLTVPRGAVLNEIETVNGSVSLANFTNVTRASAVNGSVNASNLRGTARLSTVNGDVMADFEQLESGSKISLETVNGRANIVIPSDANATLKADSLNGNITNDFQLPVRKGKYVGRDMLGRLGNGDVQIHLNSVNGALTFTRKNDGRSPNPAVDLLPQKGKDSDDWDDNDDDQDVSLDTNKLNKEIAKANKVAAKTTSRAAVRAMSDAQVHLKMDMPDIDKIAADAIRLSSESTAEVAKALSSADVQARVRERSDAMARVSDAFFVSSPRIEKKSASYPVKGVAKVNVQGDGCSVTVRGWDKNEVQYRVIQIARGRDQDDFDVTDSHTDAEVNIAVANGQNARRRNVEIEVFVPRKTDLKIGASGEIRLEGVSGSVELIGGDQPINVRDVDGGLKLTSGDGMIRVVGFKGDIDAKTGDGAINLEGSFRSLNAHAANGDVTVTLPDDASAEFETNSDEVSADGIAMTKLADANGGSAYRIGKGGTRYNIQTAGEVVVRGALTIKDNL